MAITGLFGRDKTSGDVAPSFRPDARNTEQHLHRLAEESSDVVIAIDSDDKLSIVGGPVQAVFRQSAERLRGLSLLIWSVPTNGPASSGIWPTAARTHGSDEESNSASHEIRTAGARWKS